MTKITIGGDCGNSPEIPWAKAMDIAFANSDIDLHTNSVTHQIRWSIVGEKEIVGRDCFIKGQQEPKLDDISELVLDRTLAHGKEGAAPGTVYVKNGKGGAFSDFYGFKSQIRSIASYVIEIC